MLNSLRDRFANRAGRLTAAQRRRWENEGLVILPGFYSASKTGRIRQLIDRLWAKRRREDNPVVIDIFVGTERGKRIHFRDAPDEARNYPYKLNDIYMTSGRLRRFILSDPLAAILRELLDGDPLICNSLIFERGSQQDYHFDTWYMPPVVENKMVASWIALEDVREAAGPLSYYPGSHKIPPYRFSHGGLNAVPNEMEACRAYVHEELETRGLEPRTFRPKAGDVLIWHAQLLHGGLPITDPALTRSSVVTHYFRAQDTAPQLCKEFDPGRYYLKRDHPSVSA